MAETLNISSIYAQELKNIRQEQQASQEIDEAKTAGTQTRTALGLQAGAWTGRKAKDEYAKRLAEEHKFFDVTTGDDFTVSKYKEVSGESPTWWWGKEMDKDSFLGESYETLTDYLGFSDDKMALTEGYIKGGLESGSGVKELGISGESLSRESLFPDIVQHPQGVSGGPTTYTPQPVGAETTITTAGGADVGKAVLGDKGAVTISTKGYEEGLKTASEATTSSLGSAAGKISGGISIVTGGLQVAQSGFDLTEKDTYAGAAKATGGALMFTPAAPIGLALTGIGTLLDFV